MYFKFSQFQGRIIYISLASPCTSGVMKEELHSSHLTANAYSNSEKLINFGSPKQTTEGFFYYYCCLGFQGVCFCKIWNSTKQNVNHEKKLSLFFFFFKKNTKTKTQKWEEPSLFLKLFSSQTKPSLKNTFGDTGCRESQVTTFNAILSHTLSNDTLHMDLSLMIHLYHFVGFLSHSYTSTSISAFSTTPAATKLVY